MSTTKSVIPSFAIFFILSTLSFYAHGDVPLLDACLIHKVFCGSGGDSDLPTGPHIRGSASLSFVAGGTVLSVGVNRSFGNRAHTVLLCPGTLSNTGGFTGCNRIGRFKTDELGRGKFRIEIRSRAQLGQVVAINVKPFYTVIANCPDQPGVTCAPKPLYSRVVP